MYQKSLETLGYHAILEKLEDCALTIEAKEKIRTMQPECSELELKKQLRETTQARTMLDQFGAPPLSGMKHIGFYLNSAVKGELLLPEQFEEISLFLNAVRRLKSYMKKGEEAQIGIAYYHQNLSAQDELKEELDRCIRSGKVDDHASIYLKDVRRQLTISAEKASAKAERALKTNKAYLSDSFVVNRNGCLCIPVKKEYRHKVPGSVIDKSSTGFTLFIEPSAVSEFREELDFYKLEEESEERRILYTLVNMVAESEPALLENVRVIAKLDFIFSKGKLSLDMDAVEPSINLDHYIRLSKARHPMLPADTCVPLDFQIGHGINGVIITGPNTGGKTVALKTAALMCAMACSGLHVPCQDADITMVSQILCDIGDGQNITDNLSTFSAHIKNVLEILKRVTPECLIVMDELGSGTDPAEGMGIAISILEKLRLSGALFLATTHYPEVKEYASRHANTINARMEFDKESLKPLYQLSIGESGESCAFYIAKRLGIPDDMLQMAALETYGTHASQIARQLNLKKEVSSFQKIKIPGIKKVPVIHSSSSLEPSFSRGDSVTILPDSVIGIVVQPADAKGNVLVQIKKEKQFFNQKRLQLKVAATQLYPEDYDFSIIFDTVETRKARHQMERKYSEGLTLQLK